MAKQEISTSNQNALGALREDLGRMAPQFKYALPAHIPVERFMRVVMTAVQNNPALLRTTRQSFFNACMRCAQDGLLPDGREAVIVPFDAESASSETASYMPMIGGWRKKVRNSGLLRDWNRGSSGPVVVCQTYDQRWMLDGGFQNRPRQQLLVTNQKCGPLAVNF